MPWTRAARRSDFADRSILGVTCDGRRLALFRLGDDVCATSDVCPHLGASLSQGTIVEGHVECPLHFALFDIRTGVPDGSVTTRRLQTFPTRLEGDEIHVDTSGAEGEHR